MKAYLATSNPGKIRELKAIFARSALQLVTPRKVSQVVEDAESYTGNAMLKAQAMAAELHARHVAAAVLADDSGLEVDALDGRPAVESARYGGVEIAWPERRAALLSELRGVPPYRRTARFVCVLTLLQPGRDPVSARGEVHGYILEAEAGSGGFGYDPLFFYPPLNRSFAALSEKEKNGVSHRRRAGDALLALLAERG
ncbi:MAG: non-canonical purine NTP pyrophosphatase [Candidatus Eremiobacteraeota bacterium]|nr:non-canonical purine NTP pyrophosphatase [Candidatus Eremiobacteraeota bacterium]MBV9700850.1 non-canonical purine NTP pyrophosphatase [Candidatus Eremiobacteraeota bacterium]